MNDLKQLVVVRRIKKCVEFNLRSFGTLKYDWVKKTIEIPSFLPLIISLLLLIISANHIIKNY